MLVDTHAHVGRYWFEPVETLIAQMQQNEVAKTILVQVFRNHESQYELECVRKYPGRLALVVAVDTRRTDAPDALEKWAGQGVVGLRLKVHERSPGTDPLAIWRKASELGLAVSCLGNPDTFAADEFRRLVEELPNLKIALEHLAALGRDPEMDRACLRKVLALARYPNVCVKLGGFGELLPRPVPSQDPPPGEAPHLVRLVYEAFGGHRMMWGSNFPLCCGKEGYGNSMRFPMERTSFFSEQDKEWVFGKTALSFWKMT